MPVTPAAPIASAARWPATDVARHRWAHAASRLGLALALLCAACRAQAGLTERWAERREAHAQAQQASAWAASGLQTLHTTVQGLQRTWLLYRPAGLPQGRPLPVVYVFHGGGGWAEHLTDGDRYGWLAKADREGFIAVFPSGYSRLPGGRLATWDAGGCCGDARDQGIDDVGFVRAIHTELSQHVLVDAGRVFATGMSNGGMMAHRLACDMADVVVAIAAVAGTDATSACKPSRSVSVLHIHARDDDHVLFQGGAGPEAFRDASKVMDFVSVPQTMARWTERLHCPIARVTALQAPGVRCEVQQPCDGGTALELCETDEGGHSWPGASGSGRRGRAGPSQALNATDEIWRFFMSHPR